MTTTNLCYTSAQAYHSIRDDLEGVPLSNQSGSRRYHRLVGWVSAVGLLMSGAGTTLLFTQASSCMIFGFSPSTASFDYNANASSVTCTKTPILNGVYTGCPWVASSNVSWVTLTGNSGSRDRKSTRLNSSHLGISY